MPFADRRTRKRLHRLTDIVPIANGAVIGGAELWGAIAEGGRTQESSFRRPLPPDNGIPGPDTFERVFAKLDPAAFARAFGRRTTAACRADPSRISPTSRARTSSRWTSGALPPTRRVKPVIARGSDPTSAEKGRRTYAGILASLKPGDDI